MKNVFVSVLIAASFLLSGATAPIQSKAAAASKPRAISTAERAARREQALGQLDDPDRILRLSAMEDILASNDALLQSMALRKALSSTDGEVQSMALKKILSRSTPFPYEIERCANLTNNAADNNLCIKRAQRTGGFINFYFFGLNSNTGEFQVFQTNAHRPSTQDGAPYAKAGRLMGTTMRFLVMIPLATGSESCSAALKLSGQRMVGQINCGGEHTFDGGFDLL